MSYDCIASGITGLCEIEILQLGSQIHFIQLVSNNLNPYIDGLWISKCIVILELSVAACSSPRAPDFGRKAN